MSTSKLNRINPKTLASNPRADYKSWVRYESIVLAAIQKHPMPYVYRPSNMAASTVSTRLRDAIRGAIAFGHSDKISVSDLSRWWSETTVSTENGAVIIGPLGEAVASSVNGTSSDSGYVFSTLSFDELYAFCTLLNNSRIEGPVTVQHCPRLPPLDDFPNVEEIRRDDGSLILL